MRDSVSDLDDWLDDLDPPYETPDHARIGQVLDRHGIPFFYRQPTLVYEGGRHRIWRPDFTLPGYNGLVVEYADSVDDPHQHACLQRRQEVYALNQIPAVFVHPWEFSEPGWDEHLAQRVRDAGAPRHQLGAPLCSTASAQESHGGHDRLPTIGGGYR